MKIILLILALVIGSCKSFLFTGIETLDKMYVKDAQGCSYSNAMVTTVKISRIGVRKISFFIKTDHNKIFIPVMEMENNSYIGKSEEGINYTVTYFIEGDDISIRIASSKFKLLVSTDNICEKKLTVKKTDW